MGAELIEAFDRADADDAVRVIVVTGAGRGFCAGADLASGGDTFDFAGREPEQEVHRDGAGRFTLRVFESLKPVIAAINGPAVGVGATMTLPMDIRLASEDARIGFVFARRGIVPEACSSWFLPRLVSISRAWSGWPPGGCSPPVSVALARRMMWTTLGAEHPMIAHRADSRGMFLRGRSADAAERVRSFLEKRGPRFSDRVSDGLPDILPGWQPPGFE
jgi:enoyl-CoA hydratase/carnithine racemase